LVDTCLSDTADPVAMSHDRVAVEAFSVLKWWKSGMAKPAVTCIFSGFRSITVLLRSSPDKKNLPPFPARGRRPTPCGAAYPIDEFF
jgi:hypothetical protein